jgi:hypothetical protein
MLSVFGSSYRCGKLFSFMKNVKELARVLLTNTWRDASETQG